MLAPIAMTACVVALEDDGLADRAVGVAADAVFRQKPSAEECYANFLDGEWVVFSPDEVTDGN